MIAVADGAEVFALAWAEGWDIADPIPVDEWADKFRKLPRESSSEHGQWRTNRTPYLREPMQVLSDDHPCKRVVMVFGTQTGKTETGNNWTGSAIHQSPSSMMVVQPTVEMGKRWTRQRLNPMVALQPELQELIKPSRSRDSGNTATMKEFPGGFLVIAGSNSAASLSSMPVRRLFLDEVDRYPDDVDGEGHPVDIAERRTSSYPRRKILLTSSPTVKGESAIEQEFNESDQRHFYIPCPHCEHEHILQDDNLSDDGKFLCPDCGEFIEEHHKTWMLERGRWIAHNPESETPGFHLPSYYAPIGLGYSWPEIVELRSKTKGNPQKEKTYTNTIMAETYEDEHGKLDWQEIADRAGGYNTREIPDGCLMLVVGIDTQDDRWEAHTMGFGRKKWFTIDYQVIPGDPGIDDEWDKLDEVLSATFTNKYGVEMSILAMGVDTGGHYTHEAYRYCRSRAHRRVMALKGSSQTGRPILPSRPSPQDVNTAGKMIRAGVELWHVGTDTARGAVHARLKADLGKDPEDCRFRFPADLQDDFYQQLTNARYDREKERWKKPKHKRHEVSDTTNYCLAAASHPAIRFDKLRESDWAKIEAKVQPVITDMFAAADQDRPAPPKPKEEGAPPTTEETKTTPTPPIEKKPVSQETTPTKPKRKKRNGGFVGGWK